jgi:hypothetical protein
MALPSQSQVIAVSRHVVSAIGGAAAFAVTLQFLSAGDAQTITAAVTNIATGLTSIIAGLTALTPVIMAAWSAYSASHTQQIASVNAIDGVKVVKEDTFAATVTVAPPAKPTPPDAPPAKV